MICNRVAFINGKGGCGKTTSIFHVAGVLAQKGEKVLVIDLDKQRNTTDALLMDNQEEKEYTVLDFMHGTVSAQEVVKKAFFRSRGNANPKYYGVDVLGADIGLENEADLQEIDVKERLTNFIKENGYSWVLVDMPPSNKTLNEICFLQIVDFVIVPSSSDWFSLNGFVDLINTVNEARAVNDKLHILGMYLSRYMENCAVDKHVKSQLEELYRDNYIDIQIPFRADVREAVFFGRPISYYKLISPSKTAYERLVAFMEKKIKEKR